MISSNHIKYQKDVLTNSNNSFKDDYPRSTPNLIEL